MLPLALTMGSSSAAPQVHFFGLARIVMLYDLPVPSSNAIEPVAGIMYPDLQPVTTMGLMVNTRPLRESIYHQGGPGFQGFESKAGGTGATIPDQVVLAGAELVLTCSHISYQRTQKAYRFDFHGCVLVNIATGAEGYPKPRVVGAVTKTTTIYDGRPRYEVTGLVVA